MNDVRKTDDWEGEHAFGPGWFAFRGRVADNTLHSHAAIQLTTARAGTVMCMGASEAVFDGPGFLIPAGVKHRLLPCSDAILVLVEPGCAAGTMLRDYRKIQVLEDPLRAALVCDGSLEDIVDAAFAMEGSGALDERLQAALAAMANSDALGVADLARVAGLSQARLRALAQRDLGVPLAKLSSYRRLARAAEAIALGAGLAEAAAEAGFADQAHLTRTFRATIGLTPGKAARSVR